MSLKARVKYWLYQCRSYRKWKGGKWYLLKRREVVRRNAGIWLPIDVSQVAEQIGVSDKFKKYMVIAKVEDYTEMQ